MSFIDEFPKRMQPDSIVAQSRTKHHRGRKPCKNLWGRRGDMGWVSESNPETRNLVARKVRREIPKDIADQMVNGEIGKAIVNLYSVGGAIMKIDKNGIRDLSLLESFGAIKDEDPPLKMKEAIDV